MKSGSAEGWRLVLTPTTGKDAIRPPALATGDILFEQDLPRILSPTLGCPLILSAADLSRTGFEIVLACSEQEWESATFQVRALPSFQNDSVTEFSLELRERSELTEQGIPASFEDLSDTRFLINTTLRDAFLDRKATFGRVRILPETGIGHSQIRRVKTSPRPTMYDLQLLSNGRVLHTTPTLSAFVPNQPLSLVTCASFI
jgi:hypothetical protein